MNRIRLAKNNYKAVFVKWNDSVSFKKVWWTFRDLDAEMKNMQKNDYFWTLAYLVGENKQSYVFANSIHWEDGAAISCASVFAIPKGCIESIEPAAKRK